MAGTVFVLVEHWRGRISEITYELLALGRELADQSLAPLQAVLAGHDARALTRELGCADSVLYLDHPLLDDPLPEITADALAGVLKNRGMQCVLCPLTNISFGVGSLLADRLGVPSLNLCKDVRFAAGNCEASCLLYGGKVEVVVSIRAPAAVFSIRPGARPGFRGHVMRAPLVEEAAPDLPEYSSVRLRNYYPPRAGDVDITTKDVLVAAGRGLQSAERLVVANRLAEALGGATCGSRPTVDSGWLPLSRQVGCSGFTVRPRLYFALGISGAPEHVEGMRDAGLVIAVNTDPRAPIFDFAHYGIVADALEFVPVLTETLRPVSAAAAHPVSSSGPIRRET